jgi:hypothetical protein
MELSFSAVEFKERNGAIWIISKQPARISMDPVENIPAGNKAARSPGGCSAGLAVRRLHLAAAVNRRGGGSSSRAACPAFTADYDVRGAP